MFKPKSTGGMSGLTNAFVPPTVSSRTYDPADRGVPAQGRKPSSANRQQSTRRAALLAHMKGC